MNNIDLSAAESFTFSRTLDRILVNRRAVSEVFLTDFHPVNANEWIVGAQLPLSHAYFSDHTALQKHYDLLLVLECCRQAGTYGGYRQFGSPADTINMVSALQLNISRPDRLRASSNPGRLVIHVRAIDVIRTGNRTKKATPEMTLFLDGEYFGSAAIPVSLASPRLFQTLRSRMRQGPPALTSSLVPPEAPIVEPASVGRDRLTNVLIAGAERTQDCAHALLSIRPDNTNILDHDYDHIPAMALADAAVQLTTWDTGTPRHEITSLEADFDRFTEVDSPVSLVGSISQDRRYEVQFLQAGERTGRVVLQLPTLGKIETAESLK